MTHQDKVRSDHTAAQPAVNHPVSYALPVNACRRQAPGTRVAAR